MCIILLLPRWPRLNLHSFSLFFGSLVRWKSPPQFFFFFFFCFWRPSLLEIPTFFSPMPTSIENHNFFVTKFRRILRQKICYNPINFTLQCLVLDMKGILGLTSTKHMMKVPFITTYAILAILSIKLFFGVVLNPSLL